MVLGDQQDDLVVPDVGGAHPGVVHLGGENQVHLPLQQLFAQLGVGGLLVELQAHLHPVCLRHVADDDVRGKLGQGGEARHYHRAGVGVDVVGQGGDPRFQSLQGLLDVGEEQLAVFGQLHIPPPLDKKLHIQLVFQLLDGVAQAGLADIQLLRRPGVVLQLSDGLKIVQLP